MTGRTIVSAEAGWLRSWAGRACGTSTAACAETTITRVGRRAKCSIVLELTRTETHGVVKPAGALLVHLRMSGRLHVGPAPRRSGPTRAWPWASATSTRCASTTCASSGAHLHGGPPR
ncbi:MAG: hypothetical protein IPI43_32470 [Sandaracinaceae bacterium]|nr:hypothetical protein [Sandaracinaceae bacterium]